MGTTASIANSVIFFDGVCNLCAASVQFIIKRDHGNRYLFSSLQSDFAMASLPEMHTQGKDYQSLVLKEGDKLKTKSSAVLEVVRHLQGAWPILYILIVIPKPVRDFFYSLVAKNRYNWFGKRNECMIPTAELRNRFVE